VSSKRSVFFLNILTSGKSVDDTSQSKLGMSDYMIRYVLMNFIFIFGVVILLVFVAQNVAKGSVFDATVCAAMSVVGILGFIIARTKVPQIVPSFFSMLSYELLCILLIWNGDAQGAGFVFIYMYPLLTIILLGMKQGIILSGSLLIIAAVEVFVPAASRFQYHFDVSIRLVIAYILVLSVTTVFERTRQTKDNVNRQLAGDLRRFNDNLQKMVEEKTAGMLKLHDTFGRYLPDRIIRQMLESPNGPTLGGEKRLITILITDIRGFTALAERYDSETVVHLLNHYFSIMIDVIHSFDGTIIEFIGDSILAIFSAPLLDEMHADKAVACALKMQAAMEAVNAWNKENSYPQIEMGIGINTGETIVGNIGSSKAMKYNVIGKHVNLCSRVESYTVGGQVMISEYTFNAVQASLGIVQNIKVSPKGLPEPIFIFQINAIGEPFSISINETPVTIKALDPAIKAVYYIIKDKQVEAKGSGATVTGISERGAEMMLAAGASVDLFDDIKIDIADKSALAKVVRIADGTITIRFTSGSAFGTGG
jgi:class 3 adenylate cyclase